MYYSLNQNIYLVNGAKNSCLYDINTLNLYHLNEECRNYLIFIMQTPIEELILNEEQNNFLSRMINLNLLIRTSSIQSNNMSVSKTPKVNFAWIEITTACNLMCKHCYEEAGGTTPHLEMLPSDYDNIVNQLVSYGINRIQFIGGEPLIAKENLIHMIKVSYNRFESIEVFTNGTLLTDDIISILKKYHIKVALSVYSYDKNVHDSVTKVKGSWDKTNLAIQKLNNAHIPYRICNVLMKDVPLGNKNTDLYQLNSNKDIVRLSGRANLNLLTHDLIMKKLITKEYFSKKINYKLFNQMRVGHNCFSKKIYIATDLTVYPCVMERRISHGNLKNEALQNILKKDILTFSKDKVNECKFCEFRYTCFDCRPDSLNNNIFDKPWYCTYRPFTGEWINPEDYTNKILNSYTLI